MPRISLLILLYALSAAGVLLAAWKGSWASIWHFPLVVAAIWLLLVGGTELDRWQRERIAAKRNRTMRK